MNRIFQPVAAWLFLVLLWVDASAQTSANPFDLTPRLESSTLAIAAADTGNPFDLVAPSKIAEAKKPSPSKPKAPPISPEAAYGRFLFIAITGVLLLLTILMTLFRSFFRRSYLATLNDNLMNQVYRERESLGALPFILLYGYFFINAGLFVYFLAKHYNAALSVGHFQQWFYYTFAIVGIFLFKHLLLNIVGFIFPVEKEIRLYNFMIMTFAIVIGLALTLVNVLLAYGPPAIFEPMLYITLGAVALIYLFRYIRGIFLANRFLLFHGFHFLLYICSVEIAPVMVLVKLVLNQTSA